MSEIELDYRVKGPVGLKVNGHELAGMVGEASINLAPNQLPEVWLSIPGQYVGGKIDNARVSLGAESRDALASLGWAEPVEEATHLEDLATAAASENLTIVAVTNDGVVYRRAPNETAWWFAGGPPAVFADSAKMIELGRGKPLRVWTI